MRHLFAVHRDATVEKAAGDWIARCDRGLSPREAEEFAAWEAADPRHAAELARLTATWNSLDTADEVPEIMRVARELEEKQLRRSRRRFSPAWSLAALGAAAAVTVAWIFWRAPDPEAAASPRYKVVPSSAQRLTLVDGTVVELNGDSAVEPAFSAAERRVRLVRGEAHFAVAKNAARPFIVQAGNVAVRAVGTAFNVRFDPATIEVLVTEGKVRVDDAVQGRSLLAEAADVPARRDEPVTVAGPSGLEPPLAKPDVPLLKAGQRVVLPVAAAVAVMPVAVTPADIARALAWQGTQFIFERTPLEEAIAAFNSFNRSQLVLGDPALRVRKLGGTFRADNVDAFVRLLETGFEITVERRGENELVLRPAK